MTLPVINAPTYELTVPSTKEKIKYRPFLVKEQKILMMAQETQNEKELAQAMGKLVSASLNVPLDRLVSKTQNMTAALDERNEAWQRIATALGWATYDVGVEPYPFHQEIKDAAKEKRVELGKIKAKETRKKKAEIKKNIIREIMADDNLRKEYYNIPSKERNKYVDKLVKERLNK